MKYYFFPLTEKETEDPTKCGYPYAIKNKDRLIEFPDLVEVNTYDKGTTMLVYNNTTYNIFKDYVVLDKQMRIYLCKPNLSGAETRFK